jgi:hypothetical protein
MNNEDSFNTIYREVTKDVDLFQEGVFSAIEKAAKGTVNFAKDFSTGFQQGMKGQWSNPKDKADTIGFKNPPKKGQILVTQQGDIKIYAKVLSGIDNKTGQWDIEIINNYPNKTYSYFETTKYPEGIITTLYQLLADHIDPNNKQPSQQQQQQQIRQVPNDGEQVKTKSGINVYNAALKQWIIQSTNKPNPASGAIMNSWIKLQQQNQQKPQQNNKTINKRWKITYGTGAEYPALRCAVGFNTRYPNWTDEKETLKRY